MGRGRHSRRGMMLIASAGILMGLALFGLLIVQAAVLWSSGVRARAQGVVSRLASSSGLEYAAARLWQDTSRPAPPAAGNAADDWTARETPTESSGRASLSRNPSYARGDRWTDADGDGRFDPAAGDLPADDLDGNGAMEAATGRLRGRGTMGLGFSVRVRSAAGLVCVNSGELGSPTGDHDLDGFLNGRDADYESDLDGNGVPDWRDPDWIGNAHLVNLLANLGALKGVSTARTEAYCPDAAAGDPVNAIAFETSDLGRQIIAARPQGGYLSLWQVEQAIGSDDYDKVAPFLSTLGEVVPVAFPDTAKLDLLRNVGDAPEARYEFHARIDLNEASSDVLKACLRYLSASGTYRAGADATSAVVETPFVRLQKDEADAIADRIAAARPIRTWRRLLAVLASPSIPDDGSVFMEDPLCAVYDATRDGPARRRLKEDLILAQADANGYWIDPASRHRNTLEVAREASTIGHDATRVRAVPKGALAGDLVSAPFAAAGTTTQTISEFVSGIPSRLTTEWSLAGTLSGVFTVECEGWARRSGSIPSSAARGMSEIRVAGSLVLTGQQDFERLPRTLADPTAADRWDSPGGEVWTAGCALERTNLQSGPRFPFTTGATDVITGAPFANFLPDANGWPVSEYRYPAALGDLRLSAYQMSPAERGASGGPGAPVYALTFGENWTDYGGTEDTGWLDNIGDPLDRGVYAPNAPAGRDPFRCSPSQNLPAGAQAFFQGIRFGSGGGRGGPHAGAGGGGSGALVLANAAPPPSPTMVRTEWLSPESVPFEMGRFGESEISDGGDTVNSEELLSPLGGLRTGTATTTETGGTLEGAAAEAAGNVAGEIVGGTLEFLLPSMGADAIVPGLAEGQIAIKYRSGTDGAGNPVYTEYATLHTFVQTGQIGIGTSVSTIDPGTGAIAIQMNPQPQRFPPAGQPPAGMPEAGFHHVAVTFEDNPDEEDSSRITVYIDGESVGQAAARFDPSKPPLGGMVIDVRWPFDDLLVYRETLLPDAIREHAQRPRFAVDPTANPPKADGSLRSAWFVFDPERFPEGIRIRGLSYDTFIPSTTGGRFAFQVVTDTETSGAVAWDWGDWEGGAAPASKLSLPRTRLFQLRVSIEAHDDDPTGAGRWEDVWPRVEGAPTLRDTPILDELVVSYADRPRWTDCRLR